VVGGSTIGVGRGAILTAARGMAGSVGGERVGGAGGAALPAGGPVGDAVTASAGSLDGFAQLERRLGEGLLVMADGVLEPLALAVVAAPGLIIGSLGLQGGFVGARLGGLGLVGVSELPAGIVQRLQ
jgi:hypothetical protein